MLVGYMRVSSADDRQSVDLQRDALVAAGVDDRHLHTDKASGARDDRPGLKGCLDYLKSEDTLAVWKLDRLGRSLPHLLGIVTDLKARGVAFRSLTEQMDTTTPHGELLFSIFGALAQYCQAPRATRRATAHDRSRAGRADHGRARWRCEQGIGLPLIQGGAVDAARHARAGGLDRPGESLTGCRGALFSPRDSVTRCSLSPIPSPSLSGTGR